MRKVLRDLLRRSGLNLGDPKILEELVIETHLTKPQLETLLVEFATASLGLRLSTERKARLRGVSKGAYSRTKRQAMDNIRKSVYTILLLRFLGIMSDENIASIMEAAKLIAEGRLSDAMSLLRSVTLCDITKR